MLSKKIVIIVLVYLDALLEIFRTSSESALSFSWSRLKKDHFPPCLAKWKVINLGLIIVQTFTKIIINVSISSLTR